MYASFERFTLQMTLSQAESMSHQGQCDADVSAGRNIPTIKRQLDKLDADAVRAELRSTGGWEDDELTDHDTNLNRILWIAACDITEESRQPKERAPRGPSYPSIKSLMEIKDVTREDAKKIRAIMSGGTRDNDGRTRMERIDAVLRTFGVEYIPQGHNQRSPAIYYCNSGDTYDTTVLKVNGSFRVGCWGDIVERGNYD